MKRWIHFRISNYGMECLLLKYINKSSIKVFCIIYNDYPLNLVRNIMHNAHQNLEYNKMTHDNGIQQIKYMHSNYYWTLQNIKWQNRIQVECGTCIVYKFEFNSVQCPITFSNGKCWKLNYQNMNLFSVPLTKICMICICTHVHGAWMDSVQCSLIRKTDLN